VVEELAHLLDVGGRAHERDRDVVDALLDAEAEILAILRGQAGHRHCQPRERDALVVGDHAARDDPAADLAAVDRLHRELDHAVVHPHRITRPEGGEELGVVERAARGGALDLARGQREGLAGGEDRLAAHEGAEADLGPLQVLEDRDRPSPLGLALADGADDLRVLGVRAVREVEAGHVHARGHQPVERLRRAARRPDRADDLGASQASARARYWPVKDFSWRATSSGVPAAMTLPPSLPPSGPRSTIQSAVLMPSMLCSMITTVLPCSTSWFSTSSRRRMSAKWSPVVGSSRM